MSDSHLKSLLWLICQPIISGATWTALTSWPTKEISTFPFTAVHAGLSHLPLHWAIVLKLPVELNGLTSTLLPKCWFLARLQTRVATEVMPRQPTSGFTRITSLMKPALLIKHSATTTESDAHLKSSVRTASPEKDAGPKKKPKSTQSTSSAKLRARRTWWTKFWKEVPLLAPLLSPRTSLTTLEVFSKTNPAEKT